MVKSLLMTKTNILKIAAITFLSVIAWLLSVFIAETQDVGSVSRHLLFGLAGFTFSVLLVASFYRLEGKRIKLDFDFIKHLKLFGAGVLCFAIPAVLALLAVIALGAVEVSVVPSLPEAGATVLLVMVLVALSEAIPEEIIFRGYVFAKLAESKKKWLTILLQAVIFTAFAFAIGALSDSLDASFIFTYGIVLGLLRASTGGVAAPIGFHLACMTFQQSFGEQWGVFEVSNGSMLQTYLFGMIPLSIVSAFLVTKMMNSKQS